MPTVKLPVPADVAQSPAVPVAAVSAPAPSARRARPGRPFRPDRILRRGAQTGRLTHVQEIPARRGRHADVAGLGPARPGGRPGRGPGRERRGPHQARAARLARAGPQRDHLDRHGLGQVAGLPAARADRGARRRAPRCTSRPTRALAADQLRAGHLAGAAPACAPAVVDGDTPCAERAWARSHANYLLTTPDMLHHSLLPRHAHWAGLFRRLAVRRGGRVPHLPRRVRLARRPGAAPAAPGHGLARRRARPCSCSPRPPSASRPAARSC